MKKQIKNARINVKVITKEMTFNEILTKFPETNIVLMKHQMFCAMGCPMAMQETLEQGCLAHGIDVNKMLKELNQMARGK